MTTDALWQLAIVALGGVVLGTMETAYAAHLRAARFHRGWHDVTDLLWPLVGAVVVIAALALANWGEVRLWAVVGLGIGYGLWRGLGAPAAYALLLWVNRLGCRGCRIAGAPFRGGLARVAACGHSLTRHLRRPRPPA